MKRRYQKASFLILTVIMLFACSESLDSYSKKLVRNSVPGKYCRLYLSGFQDRNSIKLLAATYRDISKRWIYTSDNRGEDAPQNAEEMFRLNRFQGDCEDQAVVLSAIASEVGLVSRFCLGEEYEKEEGHIWIEILIGKSAKNHTTIKELFPEASIIKGDHYYWLAFIFPEIIKKYSVAYYVNVIN